MITLSKSELKAKMHEYFRKIEKTGEEIIVTDNNRRPVIKVSPLKSRKSPDEVFQECRDRIKFYEDITADTSDEWEEV